MAHGGTGIEVKHASLIVTATLALASTSQAAEQESGVYSLYRSSTVIQDARIHIATFDAGQKTPEATSQYNLENCQIAASLFREQEGVKVVYWCEPGRADDALGSK